MADDTLTDPKVEEIDDDAPGAHPTRAAPPAPPSFLLETVARFELPSMSCAGGL